MVKKLNCRLKENRNKKVCKKKRLGLTPKLNIKTKQESIDRVIKYVLFPLLLLVVILMIIIPEWIKGGIVALVLIAMSWIIYITPRFRQNLIGIPDNIFKGFWWAFGLFVFFFILMKNPFVKGLSIGVPTLPQAVTTFSLEPFALGTPISIIILVIIFPFAETVWKAGMIPALMNLYGVSLIQAIVGTAIIFGFILHLLAYGLVLASAETFGVALQQIQSISGLLFTATLFGGLAGWVLFKIENILPVAIAHSGINGVIVTTILAIITIL